MSFQDELAKLTAAQRQAVEHIDGPMLVLAGPGSGKTRVVTHRIANLIHHGVSPSSILAVTFTNKAAEEMKERVQRLVPGSWVWIGTFHRFCSRLLRRYARHVGLDANFTIYDTDDSRRALKQALEQLNLPLTMTTPDRIAQQISWLKNQLVSAAEYQPRAGNEMGAILRDAYPAYQERLLSANAVDFDDLLLHVAKMLQQNPDLRALLDETYPYILVDEYQDTNLAQYAIVRALSIDYPNLAVTGDPDQSIYGWRGANLNNILEFENDYPQVRVVRLEQNYRSTPNILAVADSLIRNNRRRKHKQLFTENPDGKAVRLVTYPSGLDEARDIVAQIQQLCREEDRKLSDFAIFYRTNALSRTVEYSLRDAGLPYQIVNGLEFYQRKEIKDVLAYLQVIHNPRDDVALSRIINVPPRRIGATSIKRLAHHAHEHGLSMLEAARQADTIAGLGKPARQAITTFAALMDRLGDPSIDGLLPRIDLILEKTGYLEQLLQAGTPEEDERAENVKELLSAAREFDTRQEEATTDVLGAFLEHVALVNDVDAWEETDRVTLMTLHAAKGLEFPVVFIVAVEQGILPHDRSMANDEQLEEERRLLFVGITRAQRELQLSHAASRNHRGSVNFCVPSMFLVELPRQEMEVSDPVYGGSPDWHGNHDDLVDEIPEDPLEQPYEEARYDDAADAAHRDHEHSDHQYSDPEHSDPVYDADQEACDPIPDDDHPAAWDDPFRGASRGTSGRPTGSRAARGKTPGKPTGKLPAVRTAADVADQAGSMSQAGSVNRGASSPGAAVDPAVFRVGMTVMHPQYGPGKVQELAGHGDKRVGTINFATAGPKKFVLAKSPVRPVG
jgi:DNA helicase-2/ATP-dependent DNA helicase PcrA